MSPTEMTGTSRKPLVGVTLGDPAGVGAEIALRALDDEGVGADCSLVLFGSPAAVEREAGTLRLQRPIHVVPLPTGPPVTGEWILDDTAINVVATSGDEALIPFGVVDARGGEAAVRAVTVAVEAAKSGIIDAVCTAPLNKESMRRAGYPHDGHTELIATLTGNPEVSMFLLGRQLRVAHLTTHSAIATVPGKITPKRLRSVIDIADRVMRAQGISQPRIAVAGLNPHAGEHGLFGSEEDDVMRPVLAQATADGLTVVGPVSPDAVFIEMMAGKHDIVIAAYHDQGHIPVKLIERDHAVNVTGGLPIIRTSVDHGTAFDIAGRGIADATNMVAALAMAAQLARGREAWLGP